MRISVRLYFAFFRNSCDWGVCMKREGKLSPFAGLRRPRGWCLGWLWLIVAAPSWQKWVDLRRNNPCAGFMTDANVRVRQLWRALWMRKRRKATSRRVFKPSLKQFQSGLVYWRARRQSKTVFSTRVRNYLRRIITTAEWEEKKTSSWRKIMRKLVSSSLSPPCAWCIEETEEQCLSARHIQQRDLRPRSFCAFQPGGRRAEHKMDCLILGECASSPRCRRRRRSHHLRSSRSHLQRIQMHIPSRSFFCCYSRSVEFQTRRCYLCPLR